MQLKRNVDFSKVSGIFVMILICDFYVRSVISQCDEYQWTCDDGTCIESHEQCDGSSQCPDGSDEIAYNCVGLPCPYYAYRCHYGGCIDGKHKCNHSPDCVDETDELFCDYKSPVNIQGDCRSKWEMECELTKECIDLKLTCNGQADCMDGSDETVRVCGKRECHVGFRCAYGACVSPKARCNGEFECLDRSDEAWQMCNYTRPTPATPVTVDTTPTTVTRTRITSTTEESLGVGSDELPCSLPKNLVNMVVSYASDNTTVQPDEQIEDNVEVIVVCNSKSKPQKFLCANGNWRPRSPYCTAYCDIAQLRGISTEYQCMENNIMVRCGKRVAENTKIRIGCAERYTYEMILNPQIITCTKDGIFNKKRKECRHTCGSIVWHVPLMRGGFPTKPSKTPWHVAIYSNATGELKYICGGSIISPRHIISAAHCFVDEQQRIIPARYFRIIAGKSHIRNEVLIGELPQERYVTEVHISRSYNNVSYQSDMSLLKLNGPLLYTSEVSAICIYQPKKFPQDLISLANDGTIAGYGIQDKRLMVLTLTIISNENCRQFNSSLGNDKFCLKADSLDATITKGDSGGAFVQIIDGSHYLLGVVSYASMMQDGYATSRILVISSASHIADDLWEKVEKGRLSDETLF